MPNIWSAHFGFVERKTTRALVVGEWDGHYTGKDKTWQDASADYMIANDFQITFSSPLGVL